MRQAELLKSDNSHKPQMNASACRLKLPPSKRTLAAALLAQSGLLIPGVLDHCGGAGVTVVINRGSKDKQITQAADWQRPECQAARAHRSGVDSLIFTIKGGCQSVSLGNPMGKITCLPPPAAGAMVPLTDVQVPNGRFFMLGGNSPNSADSRVWGGVPRQRS